MISQNENRAHFPAFAALSRQFQSQVHHRSENFRVNSLGDIAEIAGNQNLEFLADVNNEDAVHIAEPRYAADADQLVSLRKKTQRDALRNGNFNLADAREIDIGNRDKITAIPEFLGNFFIALHHEDDLSA